MNRFRSGGQKTCGGGRSGLGSGGSAPGAGLTYRDDEGQCVDHLQDEGNSEDLLTDVALGAREGFRAGVGRMGAPGQEMEKTHP